jgi:Ca2+/Na+ antiporter
MANDDIPQVLRLRKKHSPGGHDRPTAEDGERIIRAQSLRHAALASLVIVLVFAVLWMLVSDLLARVLPWLSMALGVLVGMAVRRAGQGIDWRFPVLAGVMVIIGALLGNIVIAAATSAREFDTNIFVILKNVTSYTWPVFFEEVVTSADLVFALFGAGIAAFFSTRRLTRREFQAVRIYREETRQ